MRNTTVEIESEKYLSIWFLCGNDHTVERKCWWKKNEDYYWTFCNVD